MKALVACVLALVPVAVAFAGCANGTTEDPALAVDGTDPDQGDAEPGTPITTNLPPSNPSGSQNGTPDGGKPKDGGAHEAGAQQAPPPPVTPPPPTTTFPTCGAPNTCATAKDLGSISGDQDAIVRNATGVDSAWVKLELAEDYHDFIGTTGLSGKITLTSPAGANFDLFLYNGCGSAPVLKSETTAVDSVHPTVQDHYGSSDSTELWVEVRNVGATCDANNKWTLKVEGNK